MVGVLGFLLSVEVVEISEELIEAVNGRQKLVFVAEVVLPKLAGGVTQRLEQFRHRRVFRTDAEVGAG